MAAPRRKTLVLYGGYSDGDLCGAVGRAGPWLARPVRRPVPAARPTADLWEFDCEEFTWRRGRSLTRGRASSFRPGRVHVGGGVQTLGFETWKPAISIFGPLNPPGLPGAVPARGLHGGFASSLFPSMSSSRIFQHLTSESARIRDMCGERDPPILWRTGEVGGHLVLPPHPCQVWMFRNLCPRRPGRHQMRLHSEHCPRGGPGGGESGPAAAPTGRTRPPRRGPTTPPWRATR